MTLDHRHNVVINASTKALGGWAWPFVSRDLFIIHSHIIQNVPLLRGNSKAHFAISALQNFGIAIKFTVKSFSKEL